MKRIRLTDMELVGSDGWIPTERTHAFYYFQVFGSWPIIAGLLIWLWTAVLVPQYGFEIAVITVVIVIVAGAMVDVFTWIVFRPSAMRVSESGIDIRRATGSVFSIPGDKLTIRPRRPEGFGYVSFGPGQGFIMSPNQFAAAKRFFPTVAQDAKSTPQPLP